MTPGAARRGDQLRLCFVADHRSPIAQQWIQLVEQQGHVVQLISSRWPGEDADTSYEPLGPPAVIEHLARHRRRTDGDHRPPDVLQSLRLRPAALRLASLLGPLELRRHVPGLRRQIDRFDPDLVHAMRIPYEGMAASLAVGDRPLVTSIWGNDLTLQAPKSSLMASATRRVLARTDALHTDCARDLALAGSWGFDGRKPALIVPGSGGVDRRRFHPGTSPLRAELGIPAGAQVILNPRGLREYVHIPEFLNAARRVLVQRPDAHIICTGFLGQGWIERRVVAWPERSRLHLLPTVTHDKMADVYRAADVSASLTSHDGTPNTLLESLACECLPVVGPVASVLEWIKDGANGLVVTPTDVDAVAATLLRALDDEPLRLRSASTNTRMIAERADLDTCMARAVQFYRTLLPA